MTTRSVLEKTAELIGLTVDFSSSGETQSKFLSCLGYVLAELTSQYEELRETEEVTSADGKIPFSALTKKVCHVLSVKQNDKKKRFTSYPTYLKVGGCGRFEVTYSYSLGTPTIAQDIVLPPKYTEEILSYGVASEFLHRTGYDEDASFYGDRYFTALKNLSVKRKDIVLPARRYL